MGKGRKRDIELKVIGIDGAEFRVLKDPRHEDGIGAIPIEEVPLPDSPSGIHPQRAFVIAGEPIQQTRL